MYNFQLFFIRIIYCEFNLKRDTFKRVGGAGFLGGNKTEARNHIAVTAVAFATNEAKPPNVIMIFCYCLGHVVESSSTLEKKGENCYGT